jgi:hypothetical protein
MGQYFRFIHENGEVNIKGIAQNFNLPWMRNFHYLDEDQMAEIFKKIIENNNWPPGKVYAKGDYNGFFVYDHINII